MSSEWIETKLADVGTFERGKSKHRPRDAVHLYGGKYPFIQTGDITAAGGKITNFRQTYNEAGLAQSKLWESNTLCITIAANIAETALLTFPACFPDSVVGFIPDSNKADVRFVEYLFRAFRNEVKSKAYGSVQENINLEVLRNLKFPIPPLQIQNTIADFLSLFDDRITLLRETNATLEAIAQALFKSWFVDFDPVHAKAQGTKPEGMDEQTAALFPDSFEESELGMVPAGWEVEFLTNAFDFKEGPGIRNWQYTNSDYGTKFINIRCIQDGDLTLKTANRITDEEANGKYLHFHLEEWDVVVSTSGTLGRSAIVRKEHLPLMLNTSVIRFRPIIEKVGFCFLYEYLNFPEFLYKLESMASGSVQKNFGPMHLKQIKFVCAPLAIISRFEETCCPLFEKIIQNRAKIDNLTDLRDTLLPRLISGQLRLPDVEEMVG